MGLLKQLLGNINLMDRICFIVLETSIDSASLFKSLRVSNEINY